MLYRVVVAVFLLLTNIAFAQDAPDLLAGKGGLFEGTIGKAKVLVLLDGSQSVYSYPKAATDIGLLLDKAGKTYQFTDRKSTRLNSSHVSQSRMPSSA